jgi:hypothetical protein
MKGQSGVEYLTMYAIAFMILLVVLAGVYYVLNVGRVVTAHCDFPIDLKCTDFFIKENGGFTLILRQSTGHPITITGFNCTSADNPGGNTTPITPVYINSGSQQAVVNSTPCYRTSGDIATGHAGNFYTGKIYITYNETDTGFVHTITGNIVVKYE